MELNSRKAHRIFFAGILIVAAFLIYVYANFSTDKNPFDNQIKNDLDTVKAGDKKIDSLQAQIIIFQDSLNVLNNNILLQKFKSEEIHKRYEREKTTNHSLSADSAIGVLFANLSDTIK